MNGAGLESGVRPQAPSQVLNPGGLYHSSNILGCYNTICDGIVMRSIISWARAFVPGFRISV